MEGSWFKRVFVGGALGAAMLLSSAVLAQAQLTDNERMCRASGQFTYDMAMSRDRGYSLTDNLPNLRQWALSNGASAWGLRYLEISLHVVYQLRMTSALELRSMEEMNCLKELGKIQQTQNLQQQADLQQQANTQRLQAEITRLRVEAERRGQR